MRSLFVYALALGFSWSTCSAQSLNLVSSSNSVSFTHWVQAPLSDGDTDADEADCFALNRYADLTYGGTVDLISDLYASHNEDPYDPIAWVEAFSRLDLNIYGELVQASVAHQQYATTSATYEVAGANPLDPVDLKFTFQISLKELDDFTYVHYGTASGGGKAWMGQAYSDAEWIQEPMWSEGVPYFLDNPVDGVNVSFNLEVEPGSEVTLTASAGHSYSENTFNLGPSTHSFTYYYVWAKSFVEIE